MTRSAWLRRRYRFRFAVPSSKANQSAAHDDLERSPSRSIVRSIAVYGFGAGYARDQKNVAIKPLARASRLSVSSLRYLFSLSGASLTPIVHISISRTFTDLVTRRDGENHDFLRNRRVSFVSRQAGMAARSARLLADTRIQPPGRTRGHFDTKTPTFVRHRIEFLDLE